jgi:hypothetical protein
MSQTGFENGDSIPRAVQISVEPITYGFEGDMMYATFDGPVGYADVRAFLDKLFVDPQFRRGMPCLIDCRRVKNRFSIADLRRTAVEHKRRPEMNVPGRAAVVATSNLIYGLLRMYEVFSEGAAVEIRVFRKPEEATAWLRGAEI